MDYLYLLSFSSFSFWLLFFQSKYAAELILNLQSHSITPTSLHRKHLCVFLIFSHWICIFPNKIVFVWIEKRRQTKCVAVVKLLKFSQNEICFFPALFVWPERRDETTDPDHTRPHQEQVLKIEFCGDIDQTEWRDEWTRGDRLLSLKSKEEVWMWSREWQW